MNNRQHLLAGGLLVLVAVLWLLTFVLPVPGWPLALARAGAEAALVGGLADWFAVTALFRHPLGLPIPHTAIIPRRKDELGRGLARFIESNFLAPDLLAAKLRSLGLAKRLAIWLQGPAASAALAARLMALLPWAVDAMRDANVRGFFRTALYQRLRAADAAPLLGRVLAAVTASGQHQQVLDHLVGGVREWLAAQSPAVHEIVDQKSSWWVPRRVDQYIADNLLTGVDEKLAELATPGTPARAELGRRWDEWIDRLQHDPAWAEKLRAALDRLLADPSVQAWLEQAWDDLRHWLADPGEGLQTGLAGALRSLGQALANDAAMQARLDARLESVLVEELAPHRAVIGAFIAETVARWAGRDAAARLEAAVGRDLRFIRINGTVVGALVGMGLWLFSTLVTSHMALTH